MAYLGRGIENLSDRVVLDSLTASATASYTLQLNSVNFVPSSASSLTVSLNGVIQKPDSSYTVSGSTLTFSSALTSSDSIDFVIAERGITLATPSAGSVNTEQLANDAVTKDKLLAHNYPAFEVYLATDQTVTDSTHTKITFDTVSFDTSSNWDSTNYRWLPTVAGKYLIYGQIYATGSIGTVIRGVTQLYVNTTVVALEQQWGSTSSPGTVRSPSFNVIQQLNGTSDYIEMTGFVDVSSGTPRLDADSAGVQKRTYFGAYRIGD